MCGGHRLNLCGPGITKPNTSNFNSLEEPVVHFPESKRQNVMYLAHGEGGWHKVAAATEYYLMQAPLRLVIRADTIFGAI